MEIMDKVKAAALSMQRYNWEQGTLAQAFLESGDTDTAILLAVEGANRQNSEGRCSHIGNSTAATDPCAVGEALVFAADKTGDDFLDDAKEKLIKWALLAAPRNEEGIVYHMVNSKEFWVDSFYMLPPFLASAGYFDEALKQINGYWSALFDKEKRLLSHRWDDGAKRFIRKDFWGVGNGWAIAGMARVRALLPDGFDAQKLLLETRIKTVLDAAMPLQAENGMFHDVLDDASTFLEVNFSQMLAYTVFRGVKEGWLEEKYLPAANKAYQAALANVDKYGLVRNVCGMPTFDHPGTAAEGQAFFILMESAREKLCL
ncbi:MAG: glycoside hydrolase family 88 protein [Clostridia bacterium]|nr:glycoside hydrolase family 88 protein [Clostridia bacterium]MBQ4638601.1 glycoside hydrolase family 88 protein [Clostridia bacterium]